MRIGIFVLALIWNLVAQAQFFGNAYEWGWIHFGIVLGVNAQRYSIEPSLHLRYDDSVKLVDTRTGPGLHIGILANVQFNKHLHLRFLPTVVLADHILYYEMWGNYTVKKRVQSTYAMAPLILYLRSDIINGVRYIALGGINVTYDMLSNAEVRQAPGLVKVQPWDVALEYGVAIEFILNTFTLGIELKWHRGLRDIYVREANSPYTRVLESLYNRGFYISFHFE